MSIDEKLITAQFFHSMNTCGIRPRETFTPIMDGATRRFAVEGDKGSDKSGSGSYFIHADDCPNWGIMDFHIHSEMQTFSFDFSVLSADERREYLKQNNLSNVQGISGTRTITETQRKEIERKKQEKANANKEIQQAALRMALAEYEYSLETYVHLHPYLKSRFTDEGIFIPDGGMFSTRYDSDMKRITYPIKRVLDKSPGGICREGELLVPMRNILTGAFQSLIHIPATPDKEKGFMKLIYTNTSIIGAAHPLIPKRSKRPDTLLVAEGITTSLACIVLTGGNSPVFSVGNCGNIYHVCFALRKRYAGKRIIVMADNDKATEAKTGHNPGIEAAENCVSAGVADYFKAPPVHDVRNYDWYDFLKEVIQNKKEGC